MVEGKYPFKEMINVLKEEFGKYGYALPYFGHFSFLIKLAAKFDRRLEFVLPFLGKDINIDNRASKRDLGIQYFDPKEGLIDMGYSLINKGKLENRIDQRKMMNYLVEMCKAKL